MKKTYSTPVILFENFTTSTSIATNCEGIVGNPSKGSCAVLGTGGIAVFDGSISACEYTSTELGQGEDQWDGACYHVSTEGDSLFNS